MNERFLIKIDEMSRFDELSKIYFEHLLTFPFCNFELRKVSQQCWVNRDKLTLFSEGDRKNAGYCFESAQKLYFKLKSLGFTVHRCLGRILNGLAVNSHELLNLPATHLLLIVELDGSKYLLDPGLSIRAPRAPLLIDQEKEKIEQPFRIRLLDGVCVLEKNNGKDWIQLFQSDFKFVDEKQIKFALLKLQQHPGELGIRDNKLVIGAVTKTGSKNLYWEASTKQFSYTIDENGKISKSNINSLEKVSEILQAEFSMKVSVSELQLYCSQKKHLIKRRWSMGSDIPEYASSPRKQG